MISQNFDKLIGSLTDTNVLCELIIVLCFFYVSIRFLASLALCYLLHFFKHDPYWEHCNLSFDKSQSSDFMLLFYSVGLLFVWVLQDYISLYLLFWLAVAASIDQQIKILPNIVLVFLFLVLLFVSSFFQLALTLSIFTIIVLLHRYFLFFQQAIGGGDIKYGLVIGFYLGPDCYLFFLVCLILSITLQVAFLRALRYANWKAPVVLGPHFYLASLFSVFS